MDGYIKSTAVAKELGMSERKIKEIARNQHVTYFTASGSYWMSDGSNGVQGKDIYTAIAKAGAKTTSNRKSGASAGAKKRTKKKG